MKPILVVDDDPQMRAALKEALERMGHHTVLSEDGRDAISKLNRSPFAMVITDMKMPKMDGLSLLKEVRRKVGKIPFLVITGYGTVDNAVEAMKEGASEYLIKPFSFDTLNVKIDSILARFLSDHEIVTGSPRMKKVMQLAENVASSDTTVLIYGESGTGKELIARYIHRLSHRRDQPFVAVNCAAIPDNLMESELFGYEKGAFTGAADRKIGKFELANGGTMLLDEIGEMTQGLQAKLLRVLQEKEVDRVGGRQPVPVDIRVIATTNRDLYRESLEGRFREDLYYRLSVLPLHVPPLRERTEDIPLLSEYFLRKFTGIFGKEIKGYSEEAREFLEKRQWRGNIREFENTVQRAVLLCAGELIGLPDFMIEEGAVPVQNNAHGIKEMEKDLILRTLENTGGNKTKAAKILGVSVRTIRNKLNEYGKFFPVTRGPQAEGR
jgi:two-component system response regulator FlrC